MNQDILDKLKDIKPLIEVEDNSLFTLVVIISISILSIFFVIIFWRYLRKKDPLDILKKLNLNNAKEVAYAFSSFDIKHIAHNNQILFQEICLDLQQYKYKKKVGSLDKKLFSKIQQLL